MLTIDDRREATRAAHEMEEPRPDWATGVALSYWQIGAQLCTRDGRKVGNAIVSSLETTNDGEFAEVFTDSGTKMYLNEAELRELFHPPRWLSEVQSHPGWLMGRMKLDRHAS